MIITTHQSSFLPYIGFWYKMLISDTFILNTASDFSTTSMYYRTYMPKKHFDELEYLTLPLDKKNIVRGMKIGDVPLREADMPKVKAQLESIFQFYMKNATCPDFRGVRDGILEALENSQPTLKDVNHNMIAFVREWLRCECLMPINSTQSFNHLDDKSERLAHQLAYFHLQSDKEPVYLSGSSGLKYLDEEAFHRQFKAKIVYQSPISEDFYHGSILHHMLVMDRDRIPDFILSKFGMFERAKAPKNETKDELI